MAMFSDGSLVFFGQRNVGTAEFKSFKIIINGPVEFQRRCVAGVFIGAVSWTIKLFEMLGRGIKIIKLCLFSKL
jgi:hypothetical protein